MINNVYTLILFFMETKTLNKKQQKATLAAKKTKPKETIKNVVAAPYNNSYWPQISPEDHKALKQVLEDNLPRIKNETINIPWRELKNVPKAERKEFRKAYVKKYQTEISETAREGIIIGVNDVTKLLENNLGSAVLISSDVQPRLMVQHVIDQAVLNVVPIIIFNDLRTLLKRICGISSVVLGIDKNINPNSKLWLIKESVEKIFQKCPAPVDHINYDRSLKDEIIIVESESKNNKPKNTESKIDEDEIRQAVYLKRESKDRRVFVPPFIEENEKSPNMEVDETGFMAFSQEPEPVVEKKIIKCKYKSLIVKRLKGDPNRQKRKIASLKRKRK